MGRQHVRSRWPSARVGAWTGAACEAGDGEVERNQNGEAPAEEADVGGQSEHEADQRYKRERDHERSRWVQHHILLVRYRCGMKSWNVSLDGLSVPLSSDDVKLPVAPAKSPVPPTIAPRVVPAAKAFPPTVSVSVPPGMSAVPMHWARESSNDPVVVAVTVQVASRSPTSLPEPSIMSAVKVI